MHKYQSNNHHEQSGGRLSFDITVVWAVWLTAAVCDTKMHKLKLNMIQFNFFLLFF